MKNDELKNNEEEVVNISKKELDALQAKSAERDAFYDKYIRAQAEFENIRKRLEREKIDFIRFANEGFMIELLPILDSLEIAEKHIAEAKDFKAVQEGVGMIQVQIQKFVKDIGLEKIKAEGEKFDPHFHEAVETVETKDKEDGVIINELKPGYKFNGKLLRPAMVRIVKKK